jgi:hypothetical protein
LLLQKNKHGSKTLNTVAWTWPISPAEICWKPAEITIFNRLTFFLDTRPAYSISLDFLSISGHRSFISLPSLPDPFLHAPSIPASLISPSYFVYLYLPGLNADESVGVLATLCMLLLSGEKVRELSVSNRVDDMIDDMLGHTATFEP